MFPIRTAVAIITPMFLGSCGTDVYMAKSAGMITLTKQIELEGFELTEWDALPFTLESASVGVANCAPMVSYVTRPVINFSVTLGIPLSCYTEGMELDLQNINLLYNGTLIPLMNSGNVKIDVGDYVVHIVGFTIFIEARVEETHSVAVKETSGTFEINDLGRICKDIVLNSNQPGNISIAFGIETGSIADYSITAQWQSETIALGLAVAPPDTSPAATVTIETIADKIGVTALGTYPETGAFTDTLLVKVMDSYDAALEPFCNFRIDVEQSSTNEPIKTLSLHSFP